jgi:hypothetical protein
MNAVQSRKGLGRRAFRVLMVAEGQERRCQGPNARLLMVNLGIPDGAGRIAIK